MSQAIVQRACAVLRSAIGDEAVVRLNFTGELRETLDALESLQPVLQDAEMAVLLHDIVLRTSLLEQVRAAPYRVMDMVDELQDTAGSPNPAKMTRMLPRLAIKRYAMAMKVVDVKDDLIRLKMYLQYYRSSEEPAITQRQQRLLDTRLTGPSFEEASVFGRGADKQRIMAVLQSAANNITEGLTCCTILPIFGLPCSGKTTLVQMVFNDDTNSLQEYNFRVWVYVSPELNFHRIGESILCQVMSGGGEKEEFNAPGFDSDVRRMEHIMKHLHELLNGKKVLLVLDDLWEEDPIQLQLLKCMITFIGDKVDVIVTTCNQAIARKICTVKPYRLNSLGDDACWEIIKKSIGFEAENEELEKIGLEIARKCRGLPAAALEYASMLVGSRDPTEWKRIMERDVWYRRRGSGLESSLFLSYMSMPPELRLCFGYCCNIFANGRHIVKDDLVHQWIALAFIEPSQISSATEIAEGYITRLLDMSFFQTAKSDPASGNEDMCSAMFTIHDLAHVFISSMWYHRPDIHYVLVTNCGGKLDDRYDNILRALCCVGCSRVEFNDGSFSSKWSLRVLELKESSVPKLPDSIWKLRHLGYLKISDFTGLITLPESFADLTNLFHIDLSDCSGLVSLPESFGKLISLVHVNLSGCCRLVSLPESFGKLISLVHVNLSGCSRLVSLPESFGKLISLVHVNLSGCSRLVSLTESFGDIVNLSHLDLSRCHGLAELPEPLQKLDKLVHLDLSFWSCFEGIGEGLGGLTNLQHLNLSHPCCHLAQQRFHLQELKDGLCKLTSLRYLNLSMCLNPIFYYKSEEDSVQYIESCVSSLSSLEHLDLSHNTFLFDLPQSLGDLNKLHTLDLSGCIRLKNVGEMKSLKFIALKNCRGLVSCNFVVRFVDDDDVYSSSNIAQLEDVNCQELQISCLEKVKSKEEARRIRLVEKQKLEKLKLSWTLDSIRSVEDSAMLGELVPPPNLQCVELNGFNGTCLPEHLGDLTPLQELKIICCKQLNSLSDIIKKLTNLKDLHIVDCPELEKWCQLEENKKMLAHIPKKNYEEHGSTSRPEIEEDCRSIDEVEAA